MQKLSNFRGIRRVYRTEIGVKTCAVEQDCTKSTTLVFDSVQETGAIVDLDDDEENNREFERPIEESFSPNGP
jgi:hypothetical protein